MDKKQRPFLALFYCQNIPGSGEEQRQSVEKEYGDTLKLFPMPCSGRVEELHLLKALEEFADAAYVVTCPQGACRYFEGNLKAKKRVDRTREIISRIGLEKERIGILSLAPASPKILSDVVKDIMKNTGDMGPSPVFHGNGERRERGRHI